MNNLYYSPNADSKANWVMDSISKGFPNCIPGNRDNPRHGPSHFWGMLHNEQTIRWCNTCKNVGVNWYFWDMPYYNRYGLVEDFMWRVSENRTHYKRTIDRPSDRFAAWGVEPAPRTTGRKILICPSSETMTRWYTGMSVKMWTDSIIHGLKKHTDRYIEVRHKPRARGTSGPLAATIPFEQQAQDTHCVVTLCSLCAVEAQLMGIATMSHPEGFAAEVSITSTEDIESLYTGDNSQWFYNLAYSQFTHNEIETGIALECMQENK